ncbi:MAG: DMT family transporter [Oceanospirillaceae bacterium]
MFLNYFKRIPLGIRYIVLSALGFALMTSFVKLVNNYHIPVFEIVAVRSIVSLVLSYADIKRKRISALGHNHKLLFARGAVGTVALMCVYFSVTTLPLAEATILQYVHPVFTALLAVIFLKEKVHNSTLVCIALCIFGLVAIVDPSTAFTSSANLPLFSVLLALLGAFGSAVAYIIVKQLSKTEDSSVIIFYFPMVALPLSAALLGSDFVMPSAQALMLMIFVGIFTQIGQLGLTKALAHGVASKITAFSYIQVVFAMILGAVIFNEAPSLWTLIGGGLILSGALINALGLFDAKVKKRV